MTYWPLVILAPPLLVTLLRGRTAWIWLSFAAGAASSVALFFYVMIRWTSGQSAWPLDWLLHAQGTVGMAENGGTYHDTYFVMANYSALGTELIPAILIGVLLFIRAHPRRSRIDVALFWAIAALFMATAFGFSLFLNSVGMPRTYADYPSTLERIVMVTSVARLLIAALALFAGIRPIRSWWRARRAA